MPRRTTIAIQPLGALLLFGAPPCQETNPDFDGPVSAGNATSGPSNPSDTGAPATGGTTSPSDSTGAPPPGSTTSAPGSTSDSGSTGSPSDSTGECMMCDGMCVDIQTDPEHCGECGNRCHPVMETCVDAACVTN